MAPTRLGGALGYGELVCCERDTMLCVCVWCECGWRVVAIGRGRRQPLWGVRRLPYREVRAGSRGCGGGGVDRTHLAMGDRRCSLWMVDGTHWSHTSTWKASRISAKAWTMLMESGAPEWPLTSAASALVLSTKWMMDGLYASEVGGESGVGGEGREDLGLPDVLPLVRIEDPAERALGDRPVRVTYVGRPAVSCGKESNDADARQRACPPHTWRRGAGRGGKASTKKAREARAPARRRVPSVRRHAMSWRGRMGARPQRPAAH
eukprot:scaffold10517_cov113-Isochrysis_galbana.AAC.1